MAATTAEPPLTYSRSRSKTTGNAEDQTSPPTGVTDHCGKCACASGVDLKTVCINTRWLTSVVHSDTFERNNRILTQ